MKRYLLPILFSIPMSALSATPTCHTHSGGNYCVYSGLVKKLYVNSGNIVLLYFDSAVDPSVPAGFGITISDGRAAAINISDNPEFAKLFYSTALAAQASGHEVVLQMRGNRHGYLKADRIWLSTP